MIAKISLHSLLLDIYVNMKVDVKRPGRKFIKGAHCKGGVCRTTNVREFIRKDSVSGMKIQKAIFPKWKGTGTRKKENGREAICLYPVYLFWEMSQLPLSSTRYLSQSFLQLKLDSFPLARQCCDLIWSMNLVSDIL